MDKELIVLKSRLLIFQLKIPQMPQNLPNFSGQAQKFWISMKKGFIGCP